LTLEADLGDPAINLPKAKKYLAEAMANNAVE
jgi:hypothetical protein